MDTMQMIWMQSAARERGRRAWRGLSVPTTPMPPADLGLTPRFYFQPPQPPPPSTLVPRVQTATPAQQQTDDLISNIIALLWDFGLTAYQPKWKRVSPGSLLLHKLCDELAASPHLTPEGKKVARSISIIAALYGLDKSDN
jgi:hypothetical protein